VVTSVIVELQLCCLRFLDSRSFPDLFYIKFTISHVVIVW